MTQHDRLCLDGSRLVAVSGSYGASGTEYRTEHEQFVKVVQSGTLIAAQFNVYSKENRIRVYGGTINYAMCRQVKMQFDVGNKSRD